MIALSREIAGHWQAVQSILTIRNEAEYDQAVERLNALLDEIGANEIHPLYELLDTLGVLIQAYEEKYLSIPAADDIAMLQYLMEEHSLKQADLPEIGSQGVVSEILNSKRSLNLRQIKALAKRFHVSPAVFI
ncbi:MAG: hypothetical protein R3C14_47270 [Caldilineaceae bacterium]